MYLRKVKGGWRAEVERHGVRTSATRATKAAAQAWALQEEAAILAGTHGDYPDKTLADAIDRYRKEVTNKRRTKRADNLRFDAILRDFPGLAGKVLHKITPDDLAAWRDTRLKAVSGSSALREAQQLRPIWTLAIDQWKWAGSSPWKGVKLPAKAHARRRGTQWSEVRQLLRSVNFDRAVAPQSPQQEAIWSYVVALHTAMRSTTGPQQINNSVDCSRTRQNFSEPNELLDKANGERLDTRAAGTAGSAHQKLEAVDAIHRTDHGCR